MPFPGVSLGQVLARDAQVVRVGSAGDQEPAHDVTRLPLGAWRPGSYDDLVPQVRVLQPGHVVESASARQVHAACQDQADGRQPDGQTAAPSRVSSVLARGSDPPEPPAAAHQARSLLVARLVASARSGPSGSGEPASVVPTVLGKVSLNTDLWPGSPQASSQPPCSLASSSAIARPRPVPPVVLARAGSARQNRSNTKNSSPGDNPTPWSRTAMATAPWSAAELTTTSRPSPCSTALTSRLRSIRSTLLRSTSATHGSAGSLNSILEPRRSASCWATSAELRTRSQTSTSSASRVAAFASYLLISSKSTSRDSNLPSWLSSNSAERRVCGSSSSLASNSRSAAILMVVRGVRSSCDTSETNCRCTCDKSSSSPIFSWRLAAISLNDLASAATSSLPRTASRSPRLPVDSSCAPWAARATGTTTHLVSSQAMPASRNNSAMPTRTSVRSTWSSSICTWVSGKK